MGPPLVPLYYILVLELGILFAITKHTLSPLLFEFSLLPI